MYKLYVCINIVGDANITENLFTSIYIIDSNFIGNCLVAYSKFSKTHRSDISYF